MAERRTEHGADGNGHYPSANDLERRLAATQAQLDAGEEALNALRVAVRARSRPASPEPPWPGPEDPAGYLQLLRERACKAGYEGAEKEELFGQDGWAKALAGARVQHLVRLTTRRGYERREHLERTISLCETLAGAQRDEAEAFDTRAGWLEADVGHAAAELRELAAEERSLPPAQRSGRALGLAATAAVATAVTDGIALVLTLNGVGGPLWITLLVATAVALALTAAIFVAGRTLAAVPGLLNGSSRLVLILLAGTLVTLVVGSLVAAGEFRRSALAGVDRGLPADPLLLAWIGAIAAFGATLAIAWWHHSGEGYWLARRRRKLEQRRAVLEEAKRASEQAAMSARSRLFEALQEGKRARSELDLLPKKIAVELAEQEAERELLLAVAAEGWAAGRRAAEESLRRREPTISRRMEQAIDSTIEAILTDSAPPSIDGPEATN